MSVRPLEGKVCPILSPNERKGNILSRTRRTIRRVDTPQICEKKNFERSITINERIYSGAQWHIMGIADVDYPITRNLRPLPLYFSDREGNLSP
jgi:hypothetical protein